MSKRDLVRVAVLGLLVCALAVPAQTAVKHIYVHDGGMSGPEPGAINGHIVRIDGSGGGLVTIMPPTEIPDHRPRGIDCDDTNGMLYFNGFGSPATTAKTWKVPMAGGPATLVLDHLDGGGNDISIDQSSVGGGCPRLYYSQSVSFGAFHGIKSFDCVGAGLVIEFDNFLNSTPYGTGADPGWWSDGLDYDEATGDIIFGDPGVINTAGSINGIQRFAAGGAVAGYVSLQGHVDGQGRGMAIHPTNGMIYFAEHIPSGAGGGFIYETSATVSGAALTTLVGGIPGRPRDVALDPTMDELYWVDETAGTVEKVSIFGGPVTVVASGFDAPDSLCLTFEDVQIPATDARGNLGLLLGFILSLGIVVAWYGAKRVFP